MDPEEDKEDQRAEMMALDSILNVDPDASDAAHTSAAVRRLVWHEDAAVSAGNLSGILRVAVDVEKEDGVGIKYRAAKKDFRVEEGALQE